MRASDLIANFNQVSLANGNFNNWGGANCTIVGGQLNITTTTSAADYGCEMNSKFDLTGSEVSVQLVNAGNQALTTFQATPLVLRIDANNAIYIRVCGGQIQAWKQVATTYAQTGSDLAYSAGTHKFFRIRESAGTTYWDWSTDRKTWTNLTSLANPIAVTNLFLTFQAGCQGIEASVTTMVVDNMNYLDSNRPASLARQFRVGNGGSTSNSVT